MSKLLHKYRKKFLGTLAVILIILPLLGFGCEEGMSTPEGGSSSQVGSPPEEESPESSAHAGNPALNLDPRNLEVTGQYLRDVSDKFRPFREINLDGLDPKVKEAFLSLGGEAAQFDMTWDPPLAVEEGSAVLSGYEIQVRISQEGDFFPLGTGASSIYDFMSQGIPGMAYYFRVRAFNDAGQTGFSNVAPGYVEPPCQENEWTLLIPSHECREDKMRTEARFKKFIQEVKPGQYHRLRKVQEGSQKGGDKTDASGMRQIKAPPAQGLEGPGFAVGPGAIIARYKKPMGDYVKRETAYKGPTSYKFSEDKSLRDKQGAFFTETPRILSDIAFVSSRHGFLTISGEEGGIYYIDGLLGRFARLTEKGISAYKIAVVSPKDLYVATRVGIYRIRLDEKTDLKNPPSTELVYEGRVANITAASTDHIFALQDHPGEGLKELLYSSNGRDFATLPGSEIYKSIINIKAVDDGKLFLTYLDFQILKLAWYDGSVWREFSEMTSKDKMAFVDMKLHSNGSLGHVYLSRMEYKDDTEKGQLYHFNGSGFDEISIKDSDPADLLGVSRTGKLLFGYHDAENWMSRMAYINDSLQGAIVSEVKLVLKSE